MKSTYLDNYFYQNPNTFKAVRKPANRTVELAVLEAKPSNAATIRFQQVCEKNGSTFSMDENSGIGRINWSGHVDIHIAKKLIRSGFEAIIFRNCTKLILDHSQLVAFETEARVWIKQLIKYKAESVSDKLDMLASTSPKSSIGSMFSSFAGETLKSELPHIKMKRFDNTNEAINWMT